MSESVRIEERGKALAAIEQMVFPGLMQGERSALLALFRELKNPETTVDMLLDLAYSIGDPLGADIRTIINQIPEEPLSAGEELDVSTALHFLETDR